MARKAVSAGLLVHRLAGGVREFLLVHPGGPFWARRDDGAWMIPKGEIDDGEDPLAAARREFEEETGVAIDGRFEALTPIVQKAGKRVLCWLVEADLDLSDVRSNTFEMEWPPRSGQRIVVPEIDKAAWWPAEQALAKILPSQRPLIVESLGKLS